MDVGFEMVDAQSSGAGAAVIAEPILSTAGMIVPPAGYFPKLKQKAAERGMKLILDEAQTSFGRLGTNFAFETLGVVPDFLTLSKALGGGTALAATITSDAIEADCREKGFVHVTSHVSDPLPAEVGLAMISVMEEDNLGARAQRIGARLRAGLETLQQRYECIGDVRGMGLLLGVEIVKDRHSKEPDGVTGRAISMKAMELGLSMNVAGSTSAGAMSAVWRVAPPLTTTEAEIDRGLAIMEDAIRSVLNG